MLGRQRFRRSLDSAVYQPTLLPMRGMDYVVKHRIAGMGSLGHPRYMAVGEFESGRVAREAKALVPSASTWARNGAGPVDYLYQAITDRAVRSRDPFVQLQGHWVVRRLAPDSSRIELTSLPDVRTETRLLHAMGKETANIHLGSKQAVPAIQKDLTERSAGWLQSAAAAMTQATQDDWQAWKST